MEYPTVTFELNPEVYGVLFNALTNYEGDLRADLFYDEEHGVSHLDDDRERVRLAGEMLAHLETANSSVGV
jgi:hypothetical protein